MNEYRRRSLSTSTNHNPPQVTPPPSPADSEENTGIYHAYTTILTQANKKGGRHEGTTVNNRRMHEKEVIVAEIGITALFLEEAKKASKRKGMEKGALYHIINNVKKKSHHQTIDYFM